MDADAVRMVNLVECLAEDHPDVPLPPDDDIPTWSESDVRAYFSSGGSTRPEPRDFSVPGGARDISFGADPREHAENAPLVADSFRDEKLTPERYRSAAFARGIPFRKHGLFPFYDPLLTELARDPKTSAFQKNVVAYAYAESPSQPTSIEYRVAESWANGDCAARAGVDLRCFYREPKFGEPFGSLTAAFRLGTGAAIGQMAFTSAHGGSIETVLDETTAELVKCSRAPNCATTELAVKILKPVALHRTFRADCWIASVTDFRARVKATITDPTNGTVYATCDATLADVGAIEKLKRK